MEDSADASDPLGKGADCCSPELLSEDVEVEDDEVEEGSGESDIVEGNEKS